LTQIWCFQHSIALDLLEGIFRKGGDLLPDLVERDLPRVNNPSRNQVLGHEGKALLFGVDV
jgi:hypothetical protein